MKNGGHLASGLFELLFGILAIVLIAIFSTFALRNIISMTLAAYFIIRGAVRIIKWIKNNKSDT